MGEYIWSIGTYTHDRDQSRANKGLTICRESASRFRVYAVGELCRKIQYSRRSLRRY